MLSRDIAKNVGDVFLRHSVEEAVFLMDSELRSRFAAFEPATVNLIKL